MAARVRASTASVLAHVPRVSAKRRACSGFTFTQRKLLFTLRSKVAGDGYVGLYTTRTGSCVPIQRRKARGPAVVFSIRQSCCAKVGTDFVQQNMLKQ
jgi:hypothetical protein